jgi:hypothetical protein
VSQRPVQAKGVVHKLVADTAKGMAGAVWEELCTRHNDFYRQWPSCDAFIAARWHSFIQPAREQLAAMLHPSMNYCVSEVMRAEIHDALLKNAAANPAANQVAKLLN